MGRVRGKLTASITIGGSPREVHGVSPAGASPADCPQRLSTRQLRGRPPPAVRPAEPARPRALHVPHLAPQPVLWIPRLWPRRADVDSAAAPRAAAETRPPPHPRRPVVGAVGRQSLHPPLRPSLCPFVPLSAAPPRARLAGGSARTPRPAPTVVMISFLEYSSGTTVVPSGRNLSQPQPLQPEPSA